MKKPTIRNDFNIHSANEKHDQHKLNREILLNARKKQLLEEQETLDNKPFEWLTESSRSFLAAGYIEPTSSPEKRIREIAERAENILGIDGYADKFYNYMSRGFYSLASPVWSNFGKERGLPISCFGSHIDDDIGNILYTQSHT